MAYSYEDNTAEGVPTILTKEGRGARYAATRGLFLAHRLGKVQYYNGHDQQDFVVFLTGNPRGNSLDEVESVAFYIGPNHCDGQMFVTRRDSNSEEDMNAHPSDIFAVKAAADGEGLVTCVVTMKDGAQIELTRWVDFEHTKKKLKPSRKNVRKKKLTLSEQEATLNEEVTKLGRQLNTCRERLLKATALVASTDAGIGDPHVDYSRFPDEVISLDSDIVRASNAFETTQREFTEKLLQLRALNK